MKILFAILFLFCVLFSFRNAVEKKQSTNPAHISFAGDTTIKGKEQYAYIKTIFKKNGVSYIVADYIQFLTGKKAFEAAKKHGDLDTTYDDKGNVSDVFVDDDYYIVNENDKLRDLPLSENVVIELHSTDEHKPGLVKVSVADFGKKLPDAPYLLTISNEKVIEITQVYVP